MKKQRKHYTAEEKVAILRRHLLEQEPVSKLCDELGLRPTVFYRWQKEFFENGAAAFEPKSPPEHQAEQERIEYLEKKIQRKDEVLAELMEEHIALKKESWGDLKGSGCRTMCGTRSWISCGAGQRQRDPRRAIRWLVGRDRRASSTTGRALRQRQRTQRLDSPRLLAGGVGEAAIIDFHLKNPLEGYRRLTFMMLDADIVAVSPSSVWRVLGRAGLLGKWNGKPSKKGTGFEQPLQPHEHWHVDVSYINISGTFYYLCSVLDGYSRLIVHWEMRESMNEADIEIILEAPRRNIPRPGRGSSPTTGRNSSPGTSRNSSASPA